MTSPIKISVHKIVDLILRCGDIDNRFNDSSSMHRGAAAHRKIQKTAGEHYKKEVTLKLETEIAQIPVIIQGRADGIISAPGGVVIDEIKTTALPLDLIYNQREQHLGQGKCYAYMYMKMQDAPPEKMTVQLTYFQLDTEETRKYEFEFTAAELEDFFADLLHKYGAWLRFERDWKEIRDASCRAAEFPFSWRKGQREFAAMAYRAVSARKNLYAAAPTGIGKTLSALFPAVKAMGEGKCEKIFYLTAKTITRTVAEDAVKHLAAGGLRFKSVTLRAKDKICPRTSGFDGTCGIEEVSSVPQETFAAPTARLARCTPDYCPNARGHFDRINDALWDLINNASDLITPAEIAEYAHKHSVCPHEFALDAALFCDLVVGDYNHVFDPSVYLRRFFDDNKKHEYVFLIDEAHNLADRVRDMYTASLRKGAFGYIRTHLKDKNPQSAELRKILRQINVGMKKIRDGEPQDFLALVETFMQSAGEWLKINANSGRSLSATNSELYGDILTLYFDANMYVLISELYDEHFTTLYETRGNDFSITLFCLDPSAVIAAGLSRGISSILFSATLMPLDYYREILGGTPDDTAISLPSPFDPAKLKITVHSGISTKYIDREASCAPIAGAIHTEVSAKKGNYLVFFPSYHYMDKVLDIFHKNHPEIKTLPQRSDMTEDERAAYLARFSADNPETLVGFTVLGGIFSEGIDLKGDRLIGSIIISVGIPMINPRQDQIRDYFNRKNGRGYEFAYMYPGMNKVLQAAGRVIRTESDEGIVLLIDSRFATEQYRRMFPGHWTNLQVVTRYE
ncbi:MAG: ATP-dependent DNA helicase [Defluviitaleaceae bacterium]|nr:ATP-dependent DNA helicase [Defluviitaleaceae bacterium]